MIDIKFLKLLHLDLSFSLQNLIPHRYVLLGLLFN